MYCVIHTPKQPPVHGAILDTLRNMAFGNRLLRCDVRNRILTSLKASSKQPPVHRAILDSLRNVAFRNRLLRCQIRNRPRNFQDSVMRPSTQVEPLHRVPEELLAARRQWASAPHLLRHQKGIRPRLPTKGNTPRMLTVSRSHNTLPNLRAAFTGNRFHQVSMRNTGDLHMYIDTIKQRSR